MQKLAKCFISLHLKQVLKTELRAGLKVLLRLVAKPKVIRYSAGEKVRKAFGAVKSF